MILKKGGSAVDAVEASLVFMEDNELFNCGKGSALNCDGKVEMDALIADGSNMKSGAVTLLTCVKNPIKVAREIMANSKHLLLGGEGAMEFAKRKNIELLDDDYFTTEYQLEKYKKEKEKNTDKDFQRSHGTTGAVALDSKGNLAAGATTGGTCMQTRGRIGDTPIFGSGAYANNKTCAAAGTGDGEYLMKSVLTSSISMLLEYKGYTLQAACDYMIHEKNKGIDGDMGVISIDQNGDFGIAYNSKTMPRAWISSDQELRVEIL